jgi:hypothetical protein
VILSSPLPVETVTITPTMSPVSSSTVTLTSTPAHDVMPPSGNSIMGFVIGILAIAILGGGIFAWLGSKKK